MPVRTLSTGTSPRRGDVGDDEDADIPVSGNVAAELVCPDLASGPECCASFSVDLPAHAPPGVARCCRIEPFGHRLFVLLEVLAEVRERCASVVGSDAGDSGSAVGDDGPDVAEGLHADLVNAGLGRPVVVEDCGEYVDQSPCEQSQILWMATTYFFSG